MKYLKLLESSTKFRDYKSPYKIIDEKWDKLYLNLENVNGIEYCLQNSINFSHLKIYPFTKKEIDKIYKICPKILSFKYTDKLSYIYIEREFKSTMILRFSIIIHKKDDDYYDIRLNFNSTKVIVCDQFNDLIKKLSKLFQSILDGII